MTKFQTKIVPELERRHWLVGHRWTCEASCQDCPHTTFAVEHGYQEPENMILSRVTDIFKYIWHLDYLVTVTMLLYLKTEFQ